MPFQIDYKYLREDKLMDSLMTRKHPLLEDRITTVAETSADKKDNDMIFHCFGKNGYYFGREISTWANLWYVRYMIAPDICAKCDDVHSNDGAGLCAQDSEELARILKEAIHNGRAAQLCAEVCESEDGSSIHILDIQEFAGFLERSGGFELY